MLLKFFTLSYILIYFGKTFPHFLCLIIYKYYPWVCIYFILFGLKQIFPRFYSLSSFCIVQFSRYKILLNIFHSLSVNNECIWNRFLFETNFFDVAAYMCTQNREKICFRAKRCPNGGDEEDRTPDPLLARQVLSQLSYTPIFGVPASS